MTLDVLKGLSAATYQRHALHGEGAVWVEKNCYADLWIELVHALGLEPRAMLGFTVAVDFLGDQWTFFKPVHDELYELYGLNVQELTVWKPLLEHAREHLAAGRWISTEADAFWLPDTAGTDYRAKHTKTTIVLNSLDEAGKRLGYFHNAGYYELQGEDFDRTFRIGQPNDPAFMPLFAELVMLDTRQARPEAALKAAAASMLAKHAQRLPADNPVSRFAARFLAELPTLRERGLDHYHAWAFAGTRQLGSAMELAAQHLLWLDAGHPQLEQARLALMELAASCKAFILRGARLVTSTRPFEAATVFDPMAQAWLRAHQALQAWEAGR
jgi:hypothetical protein